LRQEKRKSSQKKNFRENSSVKKGKKSSERPNDSGKQGTPAARIKKLEHFMEELQDVTLKQIQESILI
jgi:hypothetical protein